VHTPYCHLWPVWLCNIFPHYLINGMPSEKELLNIKCVFWFSLKLLSETFLILGRTEREVWLQICIGLHVKYLLFLISGFRRKVNEIWALLAYYAANYGNFLSTFRDNLSAPILFFKSHDDGEHWKGITINAAYYAIMTEISLLILVRC